MVAVTSETTVPAYGWELHFVGPSSTQRGSDKFYRVLVVGNLVLINYGRRHLRGQFVAHRYFSEDGALAKAREMTNEKSAKGYAVTRDMTEFTVRTVVIQRLLDLPPGTCRHPESVGCTHLVDRFKKQAAIQGTASRGASS